MASSSEGFATSFVYLIVLVRIIRKCDVWSHFLPFLTPLSEFHTSVFQKRFSVLVCHSPIGLLPFILNITLIKWSSSDDQTTIALGYWNNNKFNYFVKIDLSNLPERKWGWGRSGWWDDAGREKVLISMITAANCCGGARREAEQYINIRRRKNKLWLPSFVCVKDRQRHRDNLVKESAEVFVFEWSMKE